MIITHREARRRRNVEIAAQFHRGARALDLAARFGLSDARIYQIVSEQEKQQRDTN